MSLRGYVLNDAKGVLIYVTGEGLDRFEAAISEQAPVLARVDTVESDAYHFDEIPDSFGITTSGAQGAETRVTPDAATCAECAADIRGDNPRRKGYAFTNCTHCGPRLTILRALPYDRAQTSMAAFEMCAECAREYADPADRRFHAQPVACVQCGPRVWLEAGGSELSGDAIALAARRLTEGQIVAIKGLGGFHLACDATNRDAIALLRARKHRPVKPFAAMGVLDHIRRFGMPSSEEAALLQDPAAPIVLISKGTETLPDGLAPGQNSYGWMLPYTPLLHLLMDVVDRPLVMTSGNLSGEPQVIGNDEARDKLSGFADAFLMNDREIMRRLDDSVERLTPQGPMVLRRARGRVPGTLPLPKGFEDATQVVAYGAHLKSAICLLKNGQALLSHHLGDLDEALTWDEFQKADADYADLFDHDPQVFACDLHPDYRSSRRAASRAAGKPLVEVQHHHAHLAACLAENGWARDAGPVAGIILDGLGLGTDNTVWGGEVLLGDYNGFERAAHLAPAPLVGGDAAGREPWRNLLARLDQAGMQDIADEMLSQRPLGLLRQAMASGVNAPLSSSAGRLFDAFAAALGFEGAQSFEGEAAMWLEAYAARAPLSRAYPYSFAQWENGVIDPVPMWDAWLGNRKTDTPPEAMAMRFHAGLAQAFCTPARALVETGQAKAVALSGGCFQNATLLSLCCEQLQDLPLLIHTKTPANDGGLALGQALIAAAAHSG